MRVDGVYRIGKTRVSLDSLVYLFREGVSAEAMLDSYPCLTLEEIHGALAFYLGNQPQIDSYLREGERTAEQHHQQSIRTNTDLITRLRRIRNESQIPR